MPAVASYTSQSSDGKTVFTIQPARASIAAAFLLVPLSLICLLSALDAFTTPGGGWGLFGLVLLAAAALFFGRVIYFHAGRSTQTLVVDVTGLKTADGDNIPLEEIAGLQAVDPSGGDHVLSGWASSIITDSQGRLDRGATMAVSGLQAAAGIGATLAQRQATRDVRIEVRRHGASQRIAIARHLTADTATALVADIGRVLQSLGVLALAAAGQNAAVREPAAPRPVSRPLLWSSDTVFTDSPEGWRRLMAEAERRGWRTRAGMGGVRFTEQATGREVVASRIAEARRELGI